MSGPTVIRPALSRHLDLLDLHARYPQRYPYLLQSVSRGPQGRYDILFAFPGRMLRLQTPSERDFLSALDSGWREEEQRPGQNTDELPFRGGWFIYLGYELAAQIEPRLALPMPTSALPVAAAVRIPAAVIVDHHDGGVHIVAEQAELAARIEADIGTLGDAVTADSVRIERVLEPPAQDYRQAVQTVLDYIREGDVFQVNLSRQWSARVATDVADHRLYRQLRRANPGPFSGLAVFPEGAVLSSSPERLIRVSGEWVETRPIAGTRPRGGGRSQDQALSAELIAHPKERAEHIMLIDLERNDLGRIAVPGSVTVNELMALESYATVHHIVSNVRARKRPEATPGEVIRAVFPGGTITGCPKVRCMEIIAELEGAGRGPYTGSMGYLNLDGSMDLSILIRTMVRSGDQLSFRAGAGIVADSDPYQELEETRAKAQGMLRALR